MIYVNYYKYNYTVISLTSATEISFNLDYKQLSFNAMYDKYMYV